MNLLRNGIFCLALAPVLAACGGGGGGGDDSVDPLVLEAVEALFPINGADWNDYVNGVDPLAATDEACDIVTITDCLHGGELRAVEVGGRSSCKGLTASDSLGAFNWSCDASAGKVRMVSTGLADEKHLSDLIDFDAVAFRPNRVSVFENGALADTTPESVWWGNAFEVDNDGGTLATESTIYLVTADATAFFVINADRVGLVVQPGFTLTGELPVTGSSDVIYSGATRLWIEGRVEAIDYNRGIRLGDSHFTRLRNAHVSNAVIEAVYVNGRRMHLRYVTATDSRHGIRLASVSFNGPHATVEDAFVARNTECGLYITGSRNIVTRLNAIGNGNLGAESANVCLFNSSADANRLSDIHAGNGLYYGIWLNNPSGGDGRDNWFDKVRVTNNRQGGIQLYQVNALNYFTRILASNNSSGINGLRNNLFYAAVTVSNNSGHGLQADNFNTLFNVVASNNELNGIRVREKTTVLNAVTTDNATGIYLSQADDSYFGGLLKLGNNTTDCEVDGGTTPGLDSNCANAGTSDATASFAVNLAGSFVGKISGDDSRNASDSNGTATDAEGKAADFDWVEFENEWRAWGRDGSAFPNADHRGRWPDFLLGDGRIWDWSLSLLDLGDGGNPALLDVVPLPDGDDTVTVNWVGSPGDIRTVLRNAIEIMNDGIGNEDAFCESNETCLYMPNIGAYQGHGELISAGDFVDGALTGITLLRHRHNGR